MDSFVGIEDLRLGTSSRSDINIGTRLFTRTTDKCSSKVGSSVIVESSFVEVETWPDAQRLTGY